MFTNWGLSFKTTRASRTSRGENPKRTFSSLSPMPCSCSSHKRSPSVVQETLLQKHWFSSWSHPVVTRNDRLWQGDMAGERKMVGSEVMDFTKAPSVTDLTPWLNPALSPARGLIHRLLALLLILFFYYYEMTRVQHSEIAPTTLVTTKSLKRMPQGRNQKVSLNQKGGGKMQP